MGHCLVDDGTRWEITSSVLIGLIDSEEPHVVSFSANDEGEGRLVIVTANEASTLLQLR